MKRCHFKAPWPCAAIPNCEGCKWFYGDPARFGSYVVAPVSEISEVKAQLLEQMISCIRELAEREDFWIIKPAPVEWLTPAARIMLPDDAVTVAFKFEIPHMEMPEVD